MAEIQTNPSHYGDIDITGGVTVGDVGIIDSTTTLKLKIITDAATHAAGEAGANTISRLYGFDGVDWRRVIVDGSGNISTSEGAGTAIATPATVPVPAGPAVPLPAPPAGAKSFTVQNITGGGSIIAVQAVGSPPGSGMHLPNLANFTFNKSVAALQAEVISGPPGSVNIAFES